MPRAADMGVEDIVKVNQYLMRAEDVPGYEGAVQGALGRATAFLLLMVPQLLWPELLVEVEVIAAKAV